MTNCKRYKVAAIDLGTVSSRLVLAQVEGGAIVESSKHTEITDLGEGVDATGRFCEAAVERVLAACRMFVVRGPCLWGRCASAPRARVPRAMRPCRAAAGRPARVGAQTTGDSGRGRGAPDVFLAWRTTLQASASSLPIRAAAPRSSRRASMRLSAGSLRWRERAHWTSVAVA